MAKGSRSRSKPCDHCQQLSTVRYRIQCDASRVWFLVCPDCQARVSEGNPHYCYGGTWKAVKKGKRK